MTDHMPLPSFPWTMVRFQSPDRLTSSVCIVGPDDDAIVARHAEGWTLTEEWQVDVCVCGDRFRTDDPQRHADRHSDGHMPVSASAVAVDVVSLRDTMPPCQHVSLAGRRGAPRDPSEVHPALHRPR